jgi:rhodanese-related sulfurtransferase
VEVELSVGVDGHLRVLRAHLGPQRLGIDGRCGLHRGQALGHEDEFWSALRGVASRHVAGIADYVDAYLGPRDSIATITREELASELESGKLVVLDVRPIAEYEAGHIPNAVPIDPKRLYDQIRKIPRDAKVVAYCRGSFCAYAWEAVRALGSEGVPAQRLEEGFPEWRRAGLPVEIGTPATPVTA